MALVLVNGDLGAIYVMPSKSHRQGNTMLITRVCHMLYHIARVYGLFFNVHKGLQKETRDIFPLKNSRKKKESKKTKILKNFSKFFNPSTNFEQNFIEVFMFIDVC